MLLTTILDCNWLKNSELLSTIQTTLLVVKLIWIMKLVNNITKILFIISYYYNRIGRFINKNRGFVMFFT